MAEKGGAQVKYGVTIRVSPVFYEAVKKIANEHKISIYRTTELLGYSLLSRNLLVLIQPTEPQIPIKKKKGIIEIPAPPTW